jgi:hypothetical protein
MSMSAALTSGLAVTAFIAELLFGLTTFGAGITFNVAIHLLSLLGLVDGTSKSAVLALALPEAVVGVVTRRAKDIPLSMMAPLLWLLSRLHGCRARKVVPALTDAFRCDLP